MGRKIQGLNSQHQLDVEISNPAFINPLSKEWGMAALMSPACRCLGKGAPCAPQKGHLLQPFPSSEEVTSMLQCLLHPTTCMNVQQLWVHPSFPKTRRRWEAPTSAPARANRAAAATGFVENELSLKPPINSICCLLFMIIKFCTLLIMSPSEKLSLYVCYILH